MRRVRNRQFGTTVRRDAPRGNAPPRLGKRMEEQHCRRLGETNPSRGVTRDCFAEPVIGPAKGRTRWLAMTWMVCSENNRRHCEKREARRSNLCDTGGARRPKRRQRGLAKRTRDSEQFQKQTRPGGYLLVMLSVYLTRNSLISFGTLASPLRISWPSAPVTRMGSVLMTLE